MCYSLLIFIVPLFRFVVSAMFFLFIDKNMLYKVKFLTLIWAEFLGVHFEVGVWVEGKITPCLKLVRIKLEIWHLARKYRPMCSFRKFTFQYQDFLNFADVSTFCKKSVFFGKNSTFTQSNIVRAVLESF